MIDAIRGWPGHVKQAILAGLLLACMALLAVGLLTQNQANTPLAVLGSAFSGLFGWSAYLLVFGLAAFALAHLVEAARRTAFIRRSLLIELLVLSCLIIAEARLIGGRGTGALIGELLIQPVKGFPLKTQHTIIIGALLILLLLIFRLSLAQLWAALRWLFGGARLAGRKLGHVLVAIRLRFAGNDADPLAWDDEEPVDDLAAPVSQNNQGASHAALADEPANAPLVASGLRAPSPLPALPPLPMKAPPQPAAHAPSHHKSDTGSFSAVLAGPPLRYVLPPITLLNPVAEQRLLRQDDLVEHLARRVERTLRSFRIDAEVRRSDISIGPTVIRIGIRPVEKIKRDYRGKIVMDEDGEPMIARTRVSRIMVLQNDLALDLEADSIRMEAPVPGRPYVGVEIPNKQSRLVTLREILASREYEESRRASKLTVALGRDVAGKPRVGNLARFPHLLIAGATGAGKSVCLNSMIACLLMQATPEEVRFLMIDPKRVELTNFNGIPHLLAPVVTEVDRVVGILKRALSEMERRYRLFARHGVRNLDAYRRLCMQRPELETLPSIIVIIDELADLMMAAPDEVEHLICRLAQMARATGIHLVIATQRPSVDVITGLIKANIPTRISFMVSSVVDSRTILDMGGAERLLGRGDMLYLPVDAGKPERIQCTFLADEELERIVAHWRHAPQMPLTPEHYWEPQEEDSPNSQPPNVPESIRPPSLSEDDLLAQAEQVVREAGKVTIALLQRRLSISHNRAMRLIDLLLARGIISPHDSGNRTAERPTNPASASGHTRQSGTMLPDRSRGQAQPGNLQGGGTPFSLAELVLPPSPADGAGMHNSGIPHAISGGMEERGESEAVQW